MEVHTLRQIWIDLLRAELNGAEPDVYPGEAFTPEVIEGLFTLSKKHDLTHIVAASLRRGGVSIAEIAGDELAARYSKEEMLSLYRHERLRYAYGQICATLATEGIDHIPLKGSVIRAFYPDERMRTSCDIDILVRPDDLEAATTALVTAGYTRSEEPNYHDISFYSPAGVHLELHFNILENVPAMDVVLSDVWQYVTPGADHTCFLTDAFFLFHLFAHMSYHFLEGRRGLRPLMDIWVMEHRRGVTYTAAEDLLRRAGLYEFAAEITRLANICFSGRTGDEFSEILLSYILDGGVYGTAQNRVAVTRATSNSTAGYAVRRLFLPLHSMKILYPVLHKCPLLLPFCWVARLFKKLFTGKAGRALSELQAAEGQTADERETLLAMRERLGL